MSLDFANMYDEDSHALWNRKMKRADYYRLYRDGRKTRTAMDRAYDCRHDVDYPLDKSDGIWTYDPVKPSFSYLIGGMFKGDYNPDLGRQGMKGLIKVLKDEMANNGAISPNTPTGKVYSLKAKLKNGPVKGRFIALDLKAYKLGILMGGIK